MLHDIYSTWRVFANSHTALAGLAIIVVITLVALFANLLAPFDPNTVNLLLRNHAPTMQHWFGTDELGRDILSRIIYGARISLFAAAAAVVLALFVGVSIGVASGYFGKWLDLVTMRLIDIILSFPAFLLALLIAAILGPGLMNAIVAVAVARVPQFARIARGSTLIAKELDYVRAARAYGCRDGRIIVRHITPNILGPIIVQATLLIATSILTITGLGFLGIGVDPRTPEWGAMLGKGYQYMRSAAHVAVIPGVVVMIAVLGFNWIGDGLRDALDPKMKRFIGGTLT
jgi:peptide/nickel transport system permease protein